MPLKQRVPKLKGFNNPFRVEYTAVNLDTLSELGASTAPASIPQVLVAHGIVRKATSSRSSPAASSPPSSTSTPTPCRRRPRRRSRPLAVR